MIQVIETTQGYRVSSKEVAKWFEKRHDNVLQSYSNLKKSSLQHLDFILLNFQESKIKTLQGKKELIEIFMTRDGFSLLTMSFTGTEALKWKIKFLNAFNEMEKSVLLIPEMQKQIDHLQSLVNVQKQKQLSASRKGEMMVPVREPSLFSAEGQITYKRMSTEGIPELAKVKAQLTHTQRTMEGLARKINKMQARLDLGY